MKPQKSTYVVRDMTPPPSFFMNLLHHYIRLIIIVKLTYIVIRWDFPSGQYEKSSSNPRGYYLLIYREITTKVLSPSTYAPGCE